MKSELVNLAYEVELGPGEKLILPEALASTIGPGRWLIIVQPAHANGQGHLRNHAAFLNSYAPEDEGLYDDD